MEFVLIYLIIKFIILFLAFVTAYCLSNIIGIEFGLALLIGLIAVVSTICLILQIGKQINKLELGDEIDGNEH